jgi:hypothetical protein
MGQYKVLYGNIDTSKDQYGLIVSKPETDVVIIHPLDESAGIYFGRVFGGFAEWCTAYVPPRTNQFDYYNSQGPMYIIVPKNPKYPDEKYQIHYESGQYKDKDDKDINIGWLLKERFPQILDEMLEIEPKLTTNIALMDEKVVEDVMGFVANYLVDRIDQVIPDEPKDSVIILNQYKKILNSITVYDILENKYESHDISAIPKVLTETVIKKYNGPQNNLIDWLRRITYYMIIKDYSDLGHNKTEIIGYQKLGSVGDYYIGIKKI